MHARTWTPPRTLVRGYVNPEGDRKFDGEKDACKASQTYPVLFGAAIAALYDRERPALISASEAASAAASHVPLCIHDVLDSAPCDSCPDADLGQVFLLLTGMAFGQQ